MRNWLPAGMLLLMLAPAHGAEPPRGSDVVGELVKQLGDGDSAVRLRAARNLGKLGTAGRSAVPALVKALYDYSPDVGRWAAQVLAQTGALPELLRAARDKEARVRVYAMRALAWFGPEGKPAVPLLTTALKDRHESVRVTAIWALGEIGPEAKEAVPALAGLLAKVPVTTQQQVLQALRKIGPGGIPPLVEVARSTTSPVRLEALRTLELFGPEAREALPTLREILRKDKDVKARAAAASALGGMGADAEAAIPDLLSVLEDKEQAVQAQAATVLVHLAILGIPGVVEKVTAADQGMRWAAPLILTQFGNTPAANVLALIRELKAKDPQVRVKAILALAAFGNAARPAIPALAQDVRDDDEQVRLVAALALARLQRKGVESAVLEQAQKVQRGILGQLGQIGAMNRMGVLVQQQQQSAAILRFIQDPQVQAYFDGLVMFAMLAAILNLPSESLSQLYEMLPPAAVPAVVRGINLASAYQLGHC
jgi:HEAT repeat protein